MEALTNSRKRQRSVEHFQIPSLEDDAQTEKPVYKKGIWAKEEDILLLKLVKEQQLKMAHSSASKAKKLNWTLVSKGVKTRSCKQCRERWVNHLNPSVSKTQWTSEEDTLLLELAGRNPRKWAQIARQMPGRTENMVKIRWNSLNRSSLSRNKESRVGTEHNCKSLDAPSSSPPGLLKVQAEPGLYKCETKYEALPFIGGGISEYCGWSPEYSKSEPFIDEIFLDDYQIDSFAFDTTSLLSRNKAGNSSTMNTVWMENFVPINL